MQKTFNLIFIVLIFNCSQLFAQKKIPLPSKNQLESADMEYYLFAHFGPNTFTEKEWGLGNEKPEVFNPTNLDCEQWVKTAIKAGAKGIIITAKHHDGFCLWPSKYSDHTIAHSPWKNGKGDVLKELSDACKKHGLKFGVYLSPWDRNNPAYGTPEYNQIYNNMIKELFQNYGPIWEFWFDGANGDEADGTKYQKYDWDLFHKTIRENSPNALMFSDIGPDLRWIGNEKAEIGKTNWNLLNLKGFLPGKYAPKTDTLNMGNKWGEKYVYAEADVSIRDGWFYHENDKTVKSPEKLFQIYLKSVGRNGNLLLNIPPNRYGRFTKEDSLALIGFKELRDKAFAKNLLHKDFLKKEKTGYNGRDYQLKKENWINCIILKENIAKGQLVENGEILLYNGKKEVKNIPFTTIGHKRILTFNKEKVTEIKINIRNSKASPSLLPAEVYLIDDSLIEK